MYFNLLAFLILITMRIWLVVSPSTYTMLVAWGEPVNALEPIAISTTSWDSCVSLCYQDVYCVLAHQTPDFCHHYQVGRVTQAQKLTAEDESKIAIKTTESVSSCPIDLASNSTQTVVITDPSQPTLNITYQLTFSQDTWNFDYLATDICNTGWQVFFRPTVNYCIGVFTDVTQFFNETEAVSGCAQYNATLSGLESNDERLWVTSKAHAGIADDKEYNSSAIRVDGSRKPNCLLATDGSKTDCQGINAFNFTDNYLVTKTGYQFAVNQPDSYTTKNMQNCLMMWVFNDTTNVKQGLSDDGYCNYTFGPYYGMRGYACGKLPGY